MKYLYSLNLYSLSPVAISCSLLLTGFSISSAVAKEACVRSASGEVVCGPLVAKPSGSTEQSSVFEKNRLRFQSPACVLNRQQEGIICSILVTNLGSTEKKAYFYSNMEGRISRAIEPNGTTSYASLVYVGADEMNRAENHRGFQRVTLDAGVATRINFTFKDVPKGVTSLSALSIGYAEYLENTLGNLPNDMTIDTAVLRNIAIQ
jgi:hypothetical protein